MGQDTNFDRLDLEVWTDGTLDGQAAVALAAELLREQFAPFQLLGRSAQTLETATTQEEAIPFEGYDMPIEQLDLSVRAYNCLKRSGLMTVGAVLEKSEDELLALRNFGEKSYLELRDKLVDHGFPAPRTDGRRELGAPPAAQEQPQAEEEGDSAEVGALGAALMEALKASGEGRGDASR